MKGQFHFAPCLLTAKFGASNLTEYVVKACMGHNHNEVLDILPSRHYFWSIKHPWKQLVPLQRHLAAWIFPYSHDINSWSALNHNNVLVGWLFLVTWQNSESLESTMTVRFQVYLWAFGNQNRQTSSLRDDIQLTFCAFLFHWGDNLLPEWRKSEAKKVMGG